MKIAVTTQDNMIFQHFGKTKSFSLFEVENNEIKNKQLLDAGANGHGALAGFLKQNGVSVLICGGIGQGARDALASQEIELVAGASGDVDSAVKEYLSGTLKHDADFQCTDHQHHHGHGHDNCDCTH